MVATTGKITATSGTITGNGINYRYINFSCNISDQIYLCTKSGDDSALSWEGNQSTTYTKSEVNAQVYQRFNNGYLKMLHDDPSERGICLDRTANHDAVSDIMSSTGSSIILTMDQTSGVVIL